MRLRTDRPARTTRERGGLLKQQGSGPSIAGTIRGRAAKAERQARRQRWHAWRAQRQARLASNSQVVAADGSVAAPPSAESFSYQSWDVWEPSESDTESPAITPDSPEFREMERDMNERAKANAEKLQQAMTMKDQGNEAFKKGEINQAIHLYTEAISLKKDVKLLYANRALAYLRRRPVRYLIFCC